MELFKIIPHNFFNIFLSGNRELYIQSLLLIYDETKNNNYDLTQNQCFIILSRYHDENIFKYKSEAFDIDVPSDKIIENYAKLILKNLTYYGWLEEITVIEEKTVYLSMPSYSIQFLEAIRNIINPATFQTEKCITNIYLNIKEVSKDNLLSWLHVQIAFDSILELERLYREMTFNLKIYYNRLLEKDSISNLIEEHFDNYTNSPLFNKYFSLKTDDNVYKFRYEIIAKVNNIINDVDLIAVVAKQIVTKKQIDENDAEDELLINLDKIKNTLEDIDKKQNIVNKKHNQYVGATLDRINYLKNRDEDFKGNMIKILNIIADSKDEEIIDVINKQKRLNNYLLYSQKSVYREKAKKESFNGQAIIGLIKEEDDEVIKQQKNDIIAKNNTKSIYKFRDSVVEEFINRNMTGRDIVTTIDFVIENNEDFIKFVMAYKLTQKKKFKYKAIILNEAIIDLGRWRLPNIEFRRG